MIPAPVERRSSLRSLRWFVATHLLRRRLLTAQVEPTGLTVRAYSRDLVGRHLYKRGVYERALTDYVLRDLQMAETAVVLDIGANLGWYSLLLAKRFPRAPVHAFEPEPRNLSLLRENVARNGLGNVAIHAAAVAAESGTMQLYPYAEKNMGRHSLLPINDGRPVTVATVAIDDFLARERIDPAQVGFVKIDIEGYEEPALRGARRLLAAGPPILSEYAPKYMRRGGLDPAQYLQLLRSAGYAPFLVEHGLRACPDRLLAGEARLDLLWVRGDGTAR